MKDVSTKIFTVSEINKEINEALRKHPFLRNCWVSGEVSNFKDHVPSGHWYFTLKDETASLRAVMFRSRASTVGFKPQNGMKVLIRGNIRLYERDGSTQLYGEEMFPSGLGALHLAYEQLKKKLMLEGLFDAKRKKPLPKYPQQIAVITSPTGAALKDILNIAHRRNPLVKIIVIPSAVQGEVAPAEIARAISQANTIKDLDLIIVGRGGGSLEELWAFNTEIVARAIADSQIPVISAVGHEIDYSIADFVADLRAPTPSAAAEIAIPLLSDIVESLCSYREQLRDKITRILETKRKKLLEISGHRSLVNQGYKIEQLRQDLDILTFRLQEGITGFFDKKDGILKLLCTKLDLLSPLTTLKRGYSLVYNPAGKIVKSIKEVEKGDQIWLRFIDGKADCAVRKVEIVD
ncbi:MAG: exodeoxyribonuclease VII large subunit [Desulfitobacteriia bacterium]